ncbi:MAG: threonine synthase [Armatimonadetes bacterium]|nr:threonine synthase [Armatimonadota bacterium]
MSPGTWRGVIEEFREFLPVTRETPVVTLLEGNTPLVESRVLSARIGRRLLIKVEGANPTGSFKDRGMTVAISKALEARSRAVVCASTGNTAASAAAYSARAGLPCFVIVPAGGVAMGKMAQALVHGAEAVSVRGTFDDAMELARTVTEQMSLTLVNSLNPHRLEGQKTVAFEICDALGRVPDLIALPVGNAGNITALWRGLAAYHERGRIAALPTLLGVQAAGAAPLVEGRRIGVPQTVASAIRGGKPAARKPAGGAGQASPGEFTKVTDEEILETQALLAREEGIFVEPASATGVAGLLRRAAEGTLPDGEVAVAIVTGHGLKDVDTALGRVRIPPPVRASFESVARVIEGVIGR